MDNKPQFGSKIPFVIVSIYLVISFSVLLLVYPSDPTKITARDSKSYHESAIAIIEIGRFSTSIEKPDEPQTIRTPGYPAFLVITYSIFGRNPLFAVILQILISAGTLLLCFSAASKLWNTEVGVISMFLLALDAVTFVINQKLLTETLFTFFALLIVWIITSLDPSQKIFSKRVASLGLVLAIGTLIRPINYYLVLVILIGFLGYGIFFKYRWNQILVALVLAGLPSFVLVGGWQIRNYLLTGSAEYSQIQGINLFHYRAASVIALRDRITLDQARQKMIASLPVIDGLSIVELGRLYRDEAISVIKRYPSLFGISLGKGFAKMMFVPGENSLLEFLDLTVAPEGGVVGDLNRLSIDNYVQKWLVDFRLQFFVSILVGIYLVILYAGALYGVYRTLRDKNKISVHILIWMILAYYLIISAGPEAYARFRVPLIPILALYAGKGIYNLLTDLPQKKWSTL